MPNNERIKVKCNYDDCHWNIGDFDSNCSHACPGITDKGCHDYINKDEAEKRLKEADEFRRRDKRETPYWMQSGRHG